MNQLIHPNSAMEIGGSSYRRVMTSHNESRHPSEAARATTLLKIKVTIDIGTWNIMAVWETRRVSRMGTEGERHNQFSQIYG